MGIDTVAYINGSTYGLYFKWNYPWEPKIGMEVSFMDDYNVALFTITEISHSLIKRSDDLTEHHLVIFGKTK